MSVVRRRCALGVLCHPSSRVRSFTPLPPYRPLGHERRTHTGDATPVGSARDGLRRLGILGLAERTLLCCGCPPSDHKAGHAFAVAVHAWVDACSPGTSYNLPRGLRFKMECNEVPARCRRHAVRNHAGNTLCSLRLSARINVCLQQFFSSYRWQGRPPSSWGSPWWVLGNGRFHDSPRRVHRL